MASAGGGVDRRRFQGPETSTPIHRLHTKDAYGRRQGAETEAEAVLSDGGLRQDDRKPTEIRPIFLKTGMVPQASGSAYIETGKTKIVCAVYGPHPTRKDAPYSSRAKLNVEVKWTPFASPGRRRIPGKDTESPTLSAQITQALLPSLRLDLLPKSAIDLYMTILECDGPLHDISSGVTAASVALAEAGVQMYGFVTAACAAIVDVDGESTVLYDPTYSEAKQARGTVSLACMPAMSSATNLSFSGNAPRALVKKVLEDLQSVCTNVHTVSVEAIQASQKPAVNGSAT